MFVVWFVVSFAAGKTVVYLLYNYARICSIFRKAGRGKDIPCSAFCPTPFDDERSPPFPRSGQCLVCVRCLFVTLQRVC